MPKHTHTNHHRLSQSISAVNHQSENNGVTIAQAQEKVDTWIKTLGVRYFSELTNLAQLVEEVGEVARIMSRRYGEQCFKSGESDADLGDELADVMFVLICIANQTGVDLTAALEKNLQKKTHRDAKRHLENPKLAKQKQSISDDQPSTES
jgi:NTP pyrophosphatase (non-canonical NTP hydrolase)